MLDSGAGDNGTMAAMRFAELARYAIERLEAAEATSLRAMVELAAKCGVVHADYPGVFFSTAVLGRAIEIATNSDQFNSYDPLDEGHPVLRTLDDLSSRAGTRSPVVLLDKTGNNIKTAFDYSRDSPVVVLPADVLGADDLEPPLAHELAHVVAHDYVFGTLLYSLEARMTDRECRDKFAEMRDLFDAALERGADRYAAGLVGPSRVLAYLQSSGKRASWFGQDGRQQEEWLRRCAQLEELVGRGDDSTNS
jgi:hypothetical protein